MKRPEPELLSQELRDIIFKKPKEPFSWLFYNDKLDILVLKTKNEDGSVTTEFVNDETKDV